MIPEFAVQIDPNSITESVIEIWFISRFIPYLTSFDFHLRYLVMALTYRSFPSGHRGSWVPRGSGTLRWHRPGLCESASRTWNQPWRNQHGGQDFPDKRWVLPEEKVERFVKNMSVQKDSRMEWMIRIDWNVFLLFRAFEWKSGEHYWLKWFFFCLHTVHGPWPMAHFRDFLTSSKKVDLRYPSWKLPVHCRLLDAQRSDEKPWGHTGQMPSLKNFAYLLVPEAQSCGRFPLFGRRTGESLMAEIR